MSFAKPSTVPIGKALSRAAHTLKGVAQNLGFDRLYSRQRAADRSDARRKAAR